MRFTKMHGLGNDFIVVDGPLDPHPAWVAQLCHRRFGIGADGLLAVSTDADLLVMGYWNADGSPAEMCGNGLRCVVRYAQQRKLLHTDPVTVRTPAGERRARLHGDLITVELGPVELTGDTTIDGHRFVTADVGNPHAVTQVDDPDTAPVETLGPHIERHPTFPNGTNVEFLTIHAPDHIALRVWERGVGETLACGSGMAAAAAVTRSEHHTDRITVDVPGGTGTVSFDGPTAWLTGPAVEVFDGTWPD